MNNLINKLFLILLMAFCGSFASAQGLEGIDVELFYESTSATSSLLPAGSKTYRVYVNMAPGYTLLSIYGNDVDVLKFNSSQNFFNDPDNGAIFANDIPTSALAAGATIVDSWLSFGSAGGNNAGNKKGNLKTLDTDGGIAGTPLTNSGGLMGSPLTTHDGRVAGVPLLPGTAGIDFSLPLFDVFGFATLGNEFSTATLPGGFAMFSNAGAASGADASNRVLIGQFTTAGTFEYRLNVQVGNSNTPETTDDDERYAANTAAPSLNLVLETNIAPTVSISTPASNLSVSMGTSVPFVATAADSGSGTIADVKFFEGTTLLATDATSPYEFTLTTPALGVRTIVARATDNLGLFTDSAPRVVTVVADPAPVVTVFTASPVSPAIAGTVITLNAAATDNGSVVSAQFVDGTTNIGASIPGAGPFSTTWTAMGPGAHTLAVIVTDNSGNTSSQTLAFTVNADPAAVVTSFTAAPGSPVAAGTSVTLTATATDNGTITGVQFKDGTTNIGAVQTVSPYTVPYAANTAGTRTLSVEVTDNAGNVTIGTLSFVVNGPAAPVFTTTPATTAIAGTSVTLNATATGTIVFRDGATTITSPWTASPVGARTLSATVTDAFGNTASSTLTFTVTPDPLPVVVLTTSLPSPQILGAAITLNATATDNGTVTGAQFKVNGVAQGPALTGTGPFSTSWTPTTDGSYTISVEVTDGIPGNLGVASSSFVISPSATYEIRRDTAVCNEESICVPIQTLQTVSNIIGYDLILEYPKAKVTPTGVIRKGTLAPANLVETSYKIENTTTANGKMLISVYFNSNAPLTERFAGPAMTDLICVEFAKKPAFLSNDSVLFTIDTLEESYITGVVGKQSKNNRFITYRDSTLNSQLIFWADRSPLTNVGTNLTNIFGANATCVKQPNPVNPDANGEFTHFLNDNELYLNIERDIVGGSGTPLATDPSVQPVINGFDAFLVRKVLLDDASFVPSIYQMIAMDVNIDGQISAGDASQINQRSVKQIGEFRQAWNYSTGGVSNGTLSKDWLFINELAIINDFDGVYSVSSTYPKWDGTGYNKDHVVQTPFCSPVPVSDWAKCAVIGEDEYIGILLGDANGNYQNLVTGAPATAGLRTNDRVIVDLANATYNANNTVDVPVTMISNDNVNALDLAMTFNDAKATYSNVIPASSDIQGYAFVNNNDNTLRLTSNGINAFGQNIVSIRFNVENGKKLTANDFVATEGYLNGEAVAIEVREKSTSANAAQELTVFPNPAVNAIFVKVAQDAKAQMFDIRGNAVSNEMEVSASKNNQIDIQNYTPGVYMIKVYNDNFVATKKIFVTK